MPGNKPSLKAKILITLFTLLVFIVISLPVTYKVTNFLGKMVSLNTINDQGCPTIAGILIHSAVFAIIIFASMFF